MKHPTIKPVYTYFSSIKYFVISLHETVFNFIRAENMFLRCRQTAFKKEGKITL